MLRFYVRQNKCFAVCDFRKFVCAQRDHKKKRERKKNSWVVSKVISIKNYRLKRLKRANKLIKASAA